MLSKKLLGASLVNTISAPPNILDSTFNMSSALVSSLTIDVPNGIKKNEVLVACISDDNNRGDLNEISTPTGWTKVLDYGTTGSDSHAAIFYKVVDGTEDSSYTWTQSVSSFYMLGWILRISGINYEVDPVEDSGYGTGSDSSIETMSTDGLVSLTSGAIGIIVTGFDGGDGYPYTLSTANGWTLYDQQTNLGTATGGSACVLYKLFDTVGSQSYPTITATTADGWVATGAIFKSV